MKLRSGFVSNSSSSSFVLDKYEAEELKDGIAKLTDRTNDLSRCTGKVTDIKKWLKQFEDEEYSSTFPVLEALVKEYGNENIIMIRESDEAMGGTFEDCGLDFDEVAKVATYKFKYH